MASLASPPGLPGVVAGFLNLRGNAVPIVRLDRLFGLPAWDPSLYSPLIILRTERPLGILVDSVKEVALPGDETSVGLGSASVFNDCVSAEVDVNGARVSILNPKRILVEQELQAISEFQTMAQQRLRELQPIDA